MNTALTSLRTALLLGIVCTVLYPALIYGVGQTVFPEQANGSLIYRDGQAIGSSLIGQANGQPQYFWPRPSAAGVPYEPVGAGASHVPFYSDAYIESVQARLKLLTAAHPDYHDPIPIDILTASASGLDPHISPAAAVMQIGRVAKARRVGEPVIATLVAQATESPQWGVFGQPRVNVLLLNLALDKELTHGQ